jgi:ADP-ribosylglycohydrolase
MVLSESADCQTSAGIRGTGNKKGMAICHSGLAGWHPQDLAGNGLASSCLPKAGSVRIGNVVEGARMFTTAFENRLRGSLIGSTIGAELGFARRVQPERFAMAQPRDVFHLKLEPAGDVREERGRIDSRPATPFINLGVQAYLAKHGRVTPEDFAALLKSEPQIAAPVFAWDGVHTTQELLKEGMHPRISGLGNAPCGLIAAAMPAVGIYHFNDPEYAYLDGVELASVTQPRLGADWAGLCAAAVAAAFNPTSSPDLVVEAVLKIAHQNNKELFYLLNQQTRTAEQIASSSEEEFARWWLTSAGRGDTRKETNWIAFNPVSFVLPLLKHFASDAQKFFALLVSPQPASWLEGMLGGHAVSAIIAGAVIGALRGLEAFPTQWRAWAEPIAAPWYPLIDIVRRRLEKERETISITDRMAATQKNGASLLRDKVYGCILAGAIGNAMGSPVEGRSYRDIDQQYPGGITTVLDPKRLEGEDDNQMAMLLVETFIERDGLPVAARHFGRTWKERLNRDHFYPLCMGNAYDLIRQGWDPRITGHWSVVTGSTVMCMEPVGIFHLGDPEFAAIDATAISYMYQRGLDVVAATILAATVAEALRPDATVDSVLQAALDAAPSDRLRTFDERPFQSAHDYLQACLEIADKYDDVLAARAELYDKCLLYHLIDPLELWGFALAMFKIARGDVRQAAIGGTNIGRDSDTIAGRAAMLSGALRGAGSIPADWVQLFKPEVLARIRRNAFRFADLVVTKKLERMKHRLLVTEAATPLAKHEVGER